ncbi:hypothetical protein AAFF_G00404790 [Aldrovandia affinis]|uniref:Uncharacterized protein n=1 Tax=Aldrovandia affinis TaxID=143900 RepID=A0AAD7T7V1_9TELE|nr:hypothetical protein AAFF_G00404790 [Aldrovandia affinis]
MLSYQQEKERVSGIVGQSFLPDLGVCLTCSRCFLSPPVALYPSLCMGSSCWESQVLGHHCHRLFHNRASGSMRNWRDGSNERDTTAGTELPEVLSLLSP